VQDEGVALTQRTTMNFVGAGVTATDAGGITVVTIPAGTGGYATVQDEGVALTTRTIINFIGASVTAVDNPGATRTDVTVSAGGAVTMTEAEVDFGTTPTWSTRFTVTDATIGASSKILVSQSGNTATGRVGTDDAEFDAIDYAATPGAGSMVMHALATPGPVVGKRKLFYTVG
jgi:hypothetical protein